MERLFKALGSMTHAPVQVTQEALRILPDGLVLGVGFFSLLTLSFSYGIFFLSLLEGLMAFHGLRALNSYLTFASVFPTKASLSNRCRTGFSTITMDSLSMFGSGLRSAFPSAPIFILSLAASYMISSMSDLSKDLEVMGSEYSSRFYVAAIFLPLVILAVALYRLYYDCDYFGNIVVSAIIGAILGLLFVEQNRRIFGDSSLNLVGIPLLRNRTVAGEKLYICPTQSKA